MVLIWEFSGVRNRFWNSKHFVVFIRVTLQTKLNVKKAQDIEVHIIQRLNVWDLGCFSGLVDNTVAKVLNGKLSQAKDPETEAQTYNGRCCPEKYVRLCAI